MVKGGCSEARTRASHLHVDLTHEVRYVFGLALAPRGRVDALGLKPRVEVVYVGKGAAHDGRERGLLARPESVWVCLHQLKMKDFFTLAK